MNISPLKYKNYRKFVQSWVAEMPNRGRGQYRRIANYCDLSTVLVSQIFKGTRELSQEHAFKMAEYFQLSEPETHYFLLLVQISRAGNHKLKKFLKEQRDKLFEEANTLKEKLPTEANLSLEQQAVFYSDWTYSAIRLSTSIDDFATVNDIAKAFDLPLEKTKALMDFLVEAGLVKVAQGQLQIGPTRTFLPADSPLVKSRQISWRTKAFEHMDHTNKNQLFFTAPLTISKKGSAEVREILLESIEKISDVVRQSEAEELHCLNMDWFNVLKR